MFTPTVWDPFSSAFAFDRPLFDQFLRRGLRAHTPARQAPHIDVRESEQAYTLTLDVPGAAASDIALDVRDQVLTLRVERKQDVPEGYRAHRLERSTFAIEQSFSLPNRLDLEAVNATLNNGVLTVTLPKLAALGPRQIPVQVAPTTPSVSEESSS